MAVLLQQSYLDPSPTPYKLSHITESLQSIKAGQISFFSLLLRHSNDQDKLYCSYDNFHFLRSAVSTTGTEGKQISRNVHHYFSCSVPLQQAQVTNSDNICEMLTPGESVVKNARATISLPQNRTRIPMKSYYFIYLSEVLLNLLQY